MSNPQIQIPTSIIDIIDYDKIAPAVLSDISNAVKGWLNGRLTEEGALTNRIIEHLVKQRRSCDVGVDSKITIESEVAILHRKGRLQTDLFGADLALTVYSPQINFVKTAFFQFKTTTRYQVKLDRKQLEAATIDPSIGSCSFVFAVDEMRSGLRLEKTVKLLSEFTQNYQSKTLDTRKWMFLVQWLWKWLSGDFDINATLNTRPSVEAMLKGYIEDDNVNFKWVQSTDKILPENYWPARAWLATKVTPEV